MTSTEHLRWDDVETRPSASKIRPQMTDRPWIPLIVDFGNFRIPITSVFTIKLYYYYINTAILLMLKYRCELFAARLSNKRLPLALAPFYSLRLGAGGSRGDPPGGRSAIKAVRAQASLSFNRSER